MLVCNNLHRRLKSLRTQNKMSLRVEFETFLASLPSVRSIYSATPEDVSRFLVWKDRHGKKIVHVADCVNTSNQNVSDCCCPKRLAFKTVDSYIGNIAPSSMKPVALATGIVCWVLGIPLPVVQSKVILKLYLRSNYVHILSLSRRSRFFHQNFCS